MAMAVGLLSKHTVAKIKVAQAKKANRRRLHPKRPATGRLRRVISADVVVVVAVEGRLGTMEDNSGVSVQSAKRYQLSRRPRQAVKPSAKLITNIVMDREPNLGTNRGAIALTAVIDQDVVAPIPAPSGLRQRLHTLAAITITALLRVINRFCFRANRFQSIRSNRKIRRWLEHRCQRMQ